MKYSPYHLTNINKGDEVGLLTTTGVTPVWKKVTVTHTTRTQVTADGQRFLRRNGEPVGDNVGQLAQLTTVLANGITVAQQCEANANGYPNAVQKSDALAVLYRLELMRLNANLTRRSDAGSARQDCLKALKLCCMERRFSYTFPVVGEGDLGSIPAYGAGDWIFRCAQADVAKAAGFQDRHLWASGHQVTRQAAEVLQYLYDYTATEIIEFYS